ncbi:MAG: DUF2219 family protein [Octadecabacter sp.]
MRNLSVSLLMFAVTATVPAYGEGREVLGYGRLFTNDYFGDNEDRWRTGGYVISQIRGAGGDGSRPANAGALMEYRLRTEIIAPSPGTADRPYSGVLSFGAHSHYTASSVDVSVGADIVAIGPGTGVSDFQEWFHGAVGAPTPTGIDTQLGDSVHFGATVEMSRSYQMSEAVTFRPFIEAQAGVEGIIRVGADVMIGRAGQRDMLLRDVVTGQLYRGIEGDDSGLNFLIGADYALVGDSAYLPADMGYVATDNRTRLRAGVHWQMFEDTSFFYGMTYLSEEFVGQTEGQLLGSLKLNFNF